MPHPLERKLARLRGRVRRHVVGAACLQAAALLMAALLALVVVDRLLRLQDRGLRAMLSLIAAGIAVYCVRAVLQAARASRFSDVQMAQRIEATLPRFRGKLASAIAFLRQRDDDPLAGSISLRRAVVNDVTSEFERADLSSLINPWPAHRSALRAGIVAALVAMLCAIDPAASRIALVRLVKPFGDLAWPRANQLAIADPVERLAQGETFEVQIVDTRGAPLPDDVAIQYRFSGPDGDVIEESEPAQFVGGTLFGRREDVQRPFAYRAVGGDDYVMPWTDLEIVEPPRVRNATVRLHSPTYTGWEPRAAELNFRALAGTKVEIHATASTPLETASVELPSNVSVPATLDADGRHITLAADADTSFVVDRSGMYRFDLEDRDGFRSASSPKYEIRAVADETPTVEIVYPKGNLFLAADAVLPLQFLARDDLAIRRMTMHVLRSDHSDEGDTPIELFVGPDTVPPEVAAASASEGYRGDVRELEHSWAIKPLGLTAGTQLTFHASIEDYGGQVGQSLPRRLSIVTPEEIQDRLADRQSLIFNELNRVLELQRTARSHLTGIEVQIEQTGKLTKADVDALQGASLNQQQVERELTAERDGLRGQITDYLDELRINNINGPNARRQMEGLLSELSRLVRGPLANAARELSAAAKAAQVNVQPAIPPAGAAEQTVRPPLMAAERGQDEIIASLERLLSEMKNSGRFRHFHREVGQLTRLQEEITAATTAVGRATLARQFADLDAQQRADLRKIAERQADLARRLARVEQQMQDEASARQDEPLAAEAIADALAHARTRGVTDAMRRASQNIDQNQIGQASEQQQHVADDLREVLDILSNRREHELGRLVKKLREAERQLADMSAAEQSTAEQLSSAASTPGAEQQQKLEQLSRQQRQLEEQAERFARTLARLQAERAAGEVAQAGAKMKKSADGAKNDDPQSAAEQAAAATGDLERARRELAETRREAEADLAQEQLARIEDAVESMRTRQDGLIRETLHYQQRQTSQGSLSRAEAASVRDLSRQQQTLADEARQLAQSLVETEAFTFALNGVRGDMTSAAARLAERDTSDNTVRLEGLALRRIEQIVDALKSQADPEQNVNEGGGGEGGGDQGQNEVSVRSISELKLIKSLQELINARTLAMELARPENSSLLPEQAQEFAALSEEQGRLADLITNMLRPVDERTENNPSRLPDVRQPTPRSQPVPRTSKGTP